MPALFLSILIHGDVLDDAPPVGGEFGESSHLAGRRKVGHPAVFYCRSLATASKSSTRCFKWGHWLIAPCGSTLGKTFIAVVVFL
jgi:hypothetical protein